MKAEDRAIAIEQVEQIRKASMKLFFEKKNTRRLDFNATEKVMGEVESLLDQAVYILRGVLAPNRAEQRDPPKDYWAWQGDGSDNLQSLVCPVLIQPADLREIIAERDNLRKANEKLVDIAQVTTHERDGLKAVVNTIHHEIRKFTRSDPH